MKLHFLVKTAALCLSLAWLPAAQAAPDLKQFFSDTQRVDQTGKKMVFAWWIPNEYWEFQAANDPDGGPQIAKTLINVVGDFTIMALIDSEMGSMGGITSHSRADIMKSTYITLADGTHLAPIPDAQLPPDLQNFIVVMKPMLANMLGQFGAGIELVAFKGKKAGGVRVLDPADDTHFSIQLGTSSFDWKLPLGSLLPPTFDPKTDETFPGNYKFNPFNGNRLQVRK